MAESKQTVDDGSLRFEFDFFLMNMKTLTLLYVMVTLDRYLIIRYPMSQSNQICDYVRINPAMKAVVVITASCS